MSLQIWCIKKFCTSKIAYHCKLFSPLFFPPPHHHLPLLVEAKNNEFLGKIKSVTVLPLNRDNLGKRLKFALFVIKKKRKEKSHLFTS